jgi:hypothetical protein
VQDQSTLRRALRAALGGRYIAYNVRYAQIAGGSVTAGVLLAQLLYWADKGADPDGWLYKTQAEWTDETGLSRSEQEIARRKLRDAGVLEEWRRGVPARLYYRIDWDGLSTALASLQTPADKDAGSRSLGAESRTLERENSQTYHTEMTTLDDEQESAPLLTRETTSAAAIWAAALPALQPQMTAANFETWWAGTIGQAIDGATLVVGAAPGTLDWLTTRCRPLARKMLRQVAPTLTDVRFVPRS